MEKEAGGEAEPSRGQCCKFTRSTKIKRRGKSRLHFGLKNRKERYDSIKHKSTKPFLPSPTYSCLFLFSLTVFLLGSLFNNVITANHHSDHPIHTIVHSNFPLLFFLVDAISTLAVVAALWVALGAGHLLCCRGSTRFRGRRVWLRRPGEGWLRHGHGGSERDALRARADLRRVLRAEVRGRPPLVHPGHFHHRHGH